MKELNEWRKSHLANWYNVKTLKTKRGLGIGNIIKGNKSLLKNWFREKLWYKAIKIRYGLNENGWHSNLGSQQD